MPAALGGHRLLSQLSKVEWRAIAARLDLHGRHLELVEGILNGFDEEAIAEELGISTHTVHTYLKRLYRKLEVRNRSDLVVRIFVTHVMRERETYRRNGRVSA